MINVARYLYLEFSFICDAHPVLDANPRWLPNSSEAERKIRIHMARGGYYESRDPEKGFTTQIKMQALSRQELLCGSCGDLIVPFSCRELASVAWGETAHAHPRKPIRIGGGGNIRNCVISCESCHYSAHEGGKYSNGMVWGRMKDFRYYCGAERCI